MKIILLFTIFTVKMVLSTFAQKIIRKSFDAPEGTHLNLHLKHAEFIEVSTWDQPSISFQASVDLNLGKLNDSLKIQYKEEGNIVSITTQMPSQYQHWISKDSYEKRYATEGMLYWKKDQAFIISDLRYKIKVPQHCSLEVETINGNIEVKGIQAKVTLNTINGFVDIDWPNSKPAKLEMGTINGEVYSDFDISFENLKKNPIVGYNLKGSYLQGGLPLLLKSINGDIFFRSRP